MSEPGCVFCKHHSLELSEATYKAINLVGIDGCLCSAGHQQEHACHCSVFDEATCDSYEFFDEGE